MEIPILCIGNQKGGTDKTTTAIEKAYRVSTIRNWVQSQDNVS